MATATGFLQHRTQTFPRIPDGLSTKLVNKRKQMTRESSFLPDLTSPGLIFNSPTAASVKAHTGGPHFVPFLLLFPLRAMPETSPSCEFLSKRQIQYL